MHVQVLQINVLVREKLAARRN